MRRKLFSILFIECNSQILIEMHEMLVDKELSEKVDIVLVNRFITFVMLKMRTSYEIFYLHPAM